MLLDPKYRKTELFDELYEKLAELDEKLDPRYTLLVSANQQGTVLGVMVNGLCIHSNMPLCSSLLREGFWKSMFKRQLVFEFNWEDGARDTGYSYEEVEEVLSEAKVKCLSVGIKNISTQQKILIKADVYQVVKDTTGIVILSILNSELRFSTIQRICQVLKNGRGVEVTEFKKGRTDIIQGLP